MTEFTVPLQPAKPDEPDTIANFPRRLNNVLQAVGLPGQHTELYPLRPGSVWSVGVKIVSPAFEGQSEEERVLPFWRAVLNDLWDEQGRVGELIALTPEEEVSSAAVLKKER